MGKKYIVLKSSKKTYRLFSEDIRTVFIKHNRKVPRLPKFDPLVKSYEDDTEEEELTSHVNGDTLSLE